MNQFGAENTYPDGLGGSVNCYATPDSDDYDYQNIRGSANVAAAGSKFVTPSSSKKSDKAQGLPKSAFDVSRPMRRLEQLIQRSWESLVTSTNRSVTSQSESESRMT